MYYNQPFLTYMNPYSNQYQQNAGGPMQYPGYERSSEASPYYQGQNMYSPDFHDNIYHDPAMLRQQVVRGQATWTDGGQVTRCGIPWSQNNFMAAAVGSNTPYRCGERLRVRNLASPGQEITVIIVDQVINYPANRLNLHRRAFEALGGNLNQGVLNIEFTPTGEEPETGQEEMWGAYLSGLVQAAYPNYRIVNYRPVDRTQQTGNRIRETYEFSLQSQEEEITVRSNVVYNPDTNRVISTDIQEV
ncbi:DUF3889 domain-containing protein [Evansella sp. LMS18]|uniref:DUF3889 domain-containing protein n=1 Tax=Evansella sp. LMS18 TaxID=2924033 RepID=UPI0020D13E40|nr:DUF3889 domain-containing protein [Evansella sp. LMS18]UTR10502.1 DUF3889 domain-containing protein [Evansella sp. LMS18]